MAAGQGFKTFTTGEVLTAGDVNGYLMQGINVFASSAARASAITSPQEGQYSFLKDTNALEYYDGAAWVGAPVGDITAVTAGTGISGGGSSGDVTITNSMATAIDAKADLVVGTGADTFSRLAVGTNGQVLTADSTVSPTGLKWATPASGSTFVGARVYGSAVQSIPNATYPVVTWNTESYDTDNFHDNTTNSSRLTIPSGKAGKYLFVLKTTFNSSSNTGARILYFFKNGAEVNESEFSLSTRGNLQMCLTSVQNASVGDYFEMIVYQSSGGALDLDKTAFYSEFSCSYLGA